MELTVYKIIRMCANAYDAMVCEMFDIHMKASFTLINQIIDICFLTTT